MTKKILLIDDEKDFTEMVKLNLEATGEYTVKSQNKASGALSAVKEFKPDLILLDIMMPEMSGGELLGLLRRDDVTKDIPVVFLTAIVKESERGTIIGPAISGRPFIAKPVSAAKLIKCIKDNLI